MRAPNLTAAARVTRRLLDQYGPARLLRVEELAPGASQTVLAAECYMGLPSVIAVSADES